jgi:hypothetical protein
VHQVFRSGSVNFTPTINYFHCVLAPIPGQEQGKTEFRKWRKNLAATAKLRTILSTFGLHLGVWCEPCGRGPCADLTMEAACSSGRSATWPTSARSSAQKQDVWYLRSAMTASVPRELIPVATNATKNTCT